MYFERKAYLKELISAEGNGMIKITKVSHPKIVG